MSPQVPHFEEFKRTMVQRDKRMLIESECKRCGWKIVGSVTDRLQQDEEEHLANCSQARNAAHS